MAYTPPIECSYPTICKSDPFDPPYASFLHTVGPYSKTHTIVNDYSVTICGVKIPIIKTNRIFTMTYSTHYDTPDTVKAIREDWGTRWFWCEELGSQWSSSVSDSGTLVKSTLHYINERHGICLFKRDTYTLALNVTGGPDPCVFKGTWGNEYYHKLLIKNSSFAGSSIKHEWVLVRNGVEEIISSTLQDWIPYFTIAGGKIWTAGWTPDPEVLQCLVLPQPPSMGIPLDDEVSYYGFYDYASDGGVSMLNQADGGCQDFFYPDWWRQYPEDPFWKRAADRRFALTWEHADPIPVIAYTPPAMAVSPIPLGDYVKHPVVGEVYQFLCDEALTGTNLNALIDTALNPLATSGTTLYYPIGIL